MQQDLDDDDRFNLTLKLKESDGLIMRNASSIRYSRKLKAKAHSIRVHDVCSSNCSRDHQEHLPSEEENEGEQDEEDDEYHPDLENIVAIDQVYLHQWHRRLYELDNNSEMTDKTKAPRWRMTIDKETLTVKVTDITTLLDPEGNDDLLDSGKKQRDLQVNDMQFTVVNGINYAENTVSFKCAN